MITLDMDIKPGRPWKEGDEVRFMGTSSTMKVFPGLFFYSAFGYGDYYSKDGHVYWASSSESRQLAERDGLSDQYQNIDSFTHYKAVYLGD